MSRDKFDEWYEENKFLKFKGGVKDGYYLIWKAGRESMNYEKGVYMENDLFNALLKVRAWIGDGEFADELPREYWTDEYKNIVDMVDKVLNENMAVKKS